MLIDATDVKRRDFKSRIKNDPIKATFLNREYERMREREKIVQQRKNVPSIQPPSSERHELACVSQNVLFLLQSRSLRLFKSYFMKERNISQ